MGTGAAWNMLYNWNQAEPKRWSWQRECEFYVKYAYPRSGKFAEIPGIVNYVVQFILNLTSIILTPLPLEPHKKGYYTDLVGITTNSI